MWIVWGGAWLVGQALPHAWPWTVYWLIVPPALALSALVVTPLVHRIKTRVTFPRAGYVEWHQPRRGSRSVAAAVAVVAALALTVLVITGTGAVPLERRLPPIMAGVISLAFLALSIRQRAPHYLAFATVAIAVSLATASLASGWDSLSWMFVALGFTCAAFGAVRLARFVRANPLASQEGL